MTSANLLASPADRLSWGQFPKCPQAAIHCNWSDELPGLLAHARRSSSTTLAFGAGRSYGDSCLAASDRVLDMQALDRFIDADWDKGRLTAQAGVTIGDILRVAIARGWFVAVTPGTQSVTLGGAIANDVHGKNHHRQGTFGRHVRGFGLLRSDQGRVICTPDENAPLFKATIGGLGLTGVIEWAEIQLHPIRSSRIEQVTQRFERLDEFFALADEFDQTHEFSVAWVDCSVRGSRVGRGIFTAGNFLPEGPLEVAERRAFTFPLTPPVPLVNAPALKIFNAVHWGIAPRQRVRTVVDYGPFLYPLDGIARWNRMYGRHGFQQYQPLIPERESRAAIGALLAEIAAQRGGSFLAVLKRCGNLPSPGLLSFPRAGTTLALDFPQSARLADTVFPRLDAIVREAGGRLYPAKDAHMSGEDFRRAYPEWEAVDAVRDPALLSRFWARVTR